MLDLLDLSTMLKCHPLSLSLAASVLSRYPLSIPQYIQQWRQRRLGEEFSVDKALYHSFEFSFEELEKTNSLSAKLLMLFSFLDHKDMWFELCLNITEHEHPEFPNWMHQIATTGFQALYPVLRNLSFIEDRWNDQTKTTIYEIHPAIHEFARKKAKERGDEEHFVRCAVSLIAANVPRSAEKDFIDIVQRLEPHVEQCTIYMKQGRGGRGLDLVEIEKFANLFRYLGRYEEASRLYLGILTALKAEENPGESTIELMADIENNLGLVYHASRQHKFAIRAFDQSYRQRFLITTRDKSALMSTLYNKGRSLLMLGKLDESLQALKMAADYFDNPGQVSQSEIMNHYDGSWKGIYFRILNDIGEVYLRRNEIDSAEQAFSTAFIGQMKFLPSLHPATFAARLNMGRVCVKRSQFAAANKIFEYIITTYIKWWGRRHSETMRAVMELAESHLQHGESKRLMGDGGDSELEMAAKLLTEVLHFYQDVYGAEADIAVLAASKLQGLQAMLNSVAQGDPYSMYYSSANNE